MMLLLLLPLLLSFTCIVHTQTKFGWCSFEYFIEQLLLNELRKK
jgi:hypothetical protein